MKEKLPTNPDILWQWVIPEINSNLPRPMKGTFPPPFHPDFQHCLSPASPQDFQVQRPSPPRPPPNPIWISIKFQDTVTGLHILQISSHLSEPLFFSRPGEIYSNVDNSTAQN